jgi:hypothetical protein
MAARRRAAGVVEVPMQRAPVLVLICGALAAGLGAVLLLVSARVEGLAWLAAPITILGVALLGLGLRPGGRRSDLEDSPGSVAPSPPGRWFPYAVLGVGVALCCWVIYWVKFR